VAHVVRNRLQSKSGEFGDTSSIPAIVLGRNQFEAWSPDNRERTGKASSKSDAYKSAAAVTDDVFSGKTPDPTGGATYFYSPKDQAAKRRPPPAFAGYPSHGAIGDHQFYSKEGPTPGFQMAGDPEATANRFGFSANGERVAPAAPPPAVSGDDAEAMARRFGFTVHGDVIPKQLLPGSMQPPTETATPADVALAAQRGLPAQVAGSVPIAGPALNWALAAGSAARPRVGETEPSFWNRLSQRQDEQRRADALFAQANPLASTAANVAGSLATLPLAATTAPGRWMLGMEGSSLGSRLYGGAFGGASINALDAALRGQNPVPAAIEGGAGGFLGPLAGEGARGVTSAAAGRYYPQSGPLAGTNRLAIDKLTNALEAETPASLAESRARMGPAGFLADINPGMTDLAGGIADTPGPGKAIVREAYRQRAAEAADRIEGAVTKAMGPPSNIVEQNQFLTEARKAAADPLYQQFRDMKVEPTPEIKALMPRLEASGAFDAAEKLSGITGEPVNRNFFTGGPQKAFPTTQSWDYVKRGLDSKIDQAYAGGDKTLARSLIGLKQNVIDEIEKTPAGQVWKQARGEFADRSALIDQITRGHDDFLGSRSGLTVDELREELKGLRGPELQARIQGARAAISDAMGDTINGDTTTRNKLLARNNQAKLRLLMGDDKANELIDSLQQERFLSAQDQNVRGGTQTTPKKERVNALQRQPLEPWWSLDLTKPTSYLPGVNRLLQAIEPTRVLEGSRAQSYDVARNALAHVLVQPGRPQTIDQYINALYGEMQRRGRVDQVAGKVGKAVSAVAVGSAPYVVRRNLENRLQDAPPQ
jgi:hypothetical protein